MQRKKSLLLIVFLFFVAGASFLAASSASIVGLPGAPFFSHYQSPVSWALH